MKELTDKGYEVVTNDFDSNDQKPVFGNSRDYIQTFIIALRHKKQAVNSDHLSSEIDHRLYEKEVHRRITFSGLNGQQLDDIVQTAVLKRSLTMDMVTKKIIPGEYTSQWQSTETYPSVAVPVVAGYHTKTKEVVACPVIEKDISEEVKYYANSYLIPVDANHNKLSEIDKRQLITNSIDPTKAIFPKLELENVVLKPIKEVKIEDPGRDYEVPYLLVHKYIAVDEKHPKKEVSPAYYRRIVTARVHYQGAGDLTPADAEQTVTETDLMATVTYAPVGKMIPIDEHGNEIKNAMRSPYINDPYDPVRVLFNEEVPEVQGYAPVNNTISVNDPFSDTKVTYTLKPRYIPVNSEHPYRPIKPTMYSVPVKETVKYQGAGEQTPTARLQAARWTRTLTADENTSELIDNGKYTTAWKVDKNHYTAVKTPVIDGYHADKNIIEAKEVKKADLNFSVVYQANGRIVPVDAKDNSLVGVEQPSYVTDPEDATKVLPKQGVPRILNYVPEQEVITVGDAGEDTRVKYYTFNEWSELKAKKKAEQKHKNLKTKKPIENKDEQEKKEKVEEKPKAANSDQKKKQDHKVLKHIFPWMK